MTTHLTRAEVCAFLKSQDNYLLLSHRRPDGDAVGSNAALCLALRAMGKKAWLYPNPQFTPKFAPYLEGLLAQTQGSGIGDRGSEDFTVICCDIATRSLFPLGAEQAQAALAIDHHGTNDGFAARSLVEPDKAACGETVLDLIAMLGVKLTKPMAEALYVAISTDTGCFRYSNVTENSFRCAGLCLAAGAEVYPINRVMFEIKRLPRLQLEAWLTQHMEFYAGGKVAVSYIDDALMQRLGLTEDDIDDISGFGRSVEGVEIAVMLRQVEGGMGKASVRSSPNYNAAAICRRLGGGGHPAAAGASVPGGIEGVHRAILQALQEELGAQWQTESSL